MVLSPLDNVDLFLKDCEKNNCELSHSSKCGGMALHSVQLIGIEKLHSPHPPPPLLSQCSVPVVTNLSSRVELDSIRILEIVLRLKDC